MRRLLVAVAVGGLVSALVAPGVEARQSDEDDGGDQQLLELGGQLVAKGPATGAAPSGPNPYLALLPDPSKIDFSGWERYVEAKSQERADQQRVAGSPILVDEDEPVGTRGSNDSVDTAQTVRGFGTRANQNHQLRILGTLSPEDVVVETVPPNAEDDGSIPLAGETGIGTERQGIFTSAAIGDGPHGSAGDGTGDFDFYAVDALAGQSVVVDTDTPTGDLDTVVAVFDATGVVVAFNDDDDDLDSRVDLFVPADGAYYVAVFGFPTFPEDPFDSGSGFEFGTEGPYDVTITAFVGDVDTFAVRLRPGDVLGASVEGSAGRVVLYDPGGAQVMGSTQDATFIYSPLSPLPGGGNAVAEHVADEPGWHYVAVSSGGGDYDITVEAYRPRLDTDRPAQTLFLDFNGARINTGMWGGPGVRTLSPLRPFLGRWGLRNADLNPVINQIITTVRENLAKDMVDSGLNPDFRLRILNSRDHAEQFGRPNVSRVIVGGTIAESGIPTIGIAQSIDPGNFGTEESALVLLDILSDPSVEFGDPSLNTYMTPASDRVAFVGRAIGNIVSHEAGHFFGDWHVDQFNDQANLMDQGGNFPLMFAVGPDGIGGTADDTDVDFGEDEFNPNEGFTGTEDTLSRLVFALTT